MTAGVSLTNMRSKTRARRPHARNMLRLSALSCVVALLLLVSATWAETSASDEEATRLAKETQNPVANLISVPFQNNFNFGTFPKDQTVWILNVQPVIPIPLGNDWNLITRTIMPIINQPSPVDGVESAAGLGDINPSFFFSPAKPGKFIWG